jgi:hypothetical protein
MRRYRKRIPIIIYRESGQRVGGETKAAFLVGQSKMPKAPSVGEPRTEPWRPRVQHQCDTDSEKVDTEMLHARRRFGYRCTCSTPCTDQKDRSWCYIDEKCADHNYREMCRNLPPSRFPFRRAWRYCNPKHPDPIVHLQKYENFAHELDLPPEPPRTKYSTHLHK